MFYWQCVQTEWIDVRCLIWLLNASEKQCLFLMSMVSSPFWFSRRTNIHYFCDDFHLWWHFSGHICDHTSLTRTVKVLISTLTLYGSKESPEKHSCKLVHMSNVWELSINYFLSWFWGCFQFFYFFFWFCCRIKEWMGFTVKTTCWETSSVLIKELDHYLDQGSSDVWYTIEISKFASSLNSLHYHLHVANIKLTWVMFDGILLLTPFDGCKLWWQK